jgi:hypothetical protein
MGYMEAIKRPFSDLTKLVIGVIIMLIPIVNLIGLGYFLQCARQTMKKSSALPEWTGWGSLFVTGLIAAIITVIWAIPTMIVAWLTIGTVLMSIAPAIATGGMMGLVSAITASIGTLMIGMAVTLVVGIIFGLLGTAAVLRYADKNNMGAAFEFSAIMGSAFKGGFIAAWIVGIIYTVLLTLVLGAIIPFVGSAIAMFLAGVAMWTMLAEAYKQ